MRMTAQLFALVISLFCLTALAHEPDMTDEAKAKKELCDAISSGAQARLRDVKMEFRWWPEAKLEPIWAEVRKGNPPTDAFYIRDDGEDEKERAALEANVMMGWHAQDEAMKSGPGVDPHAVWLQCMHTEFKESSLGLRHVASSQALKQEECRGQAAMAMMLWRLTYEYGVARDDAERMMRNAHQPEPSITEFTLWQSWVRDWGSLKEKERFLDYANGRCLNG